jgi:hypothetical protein
LLATISANDFGVDPFDPVALIVNEPVNVEVGVPEMTPFALMESPSGSVAPDDHPQLVPQLGAASAAL